MMMMSCSKSTTYEVHNGTSGYTLYDVTVYEYSGTSVIGQQDAWTIYAGSSSRSFEASRGAEKVKVSMKFTPGGEVYTTSSYTTLIDGSHTIVLLDDNTYVRGNAKGEVKIVDLK